MRFCPDISHLHPKRKCAQQRGESGLRTKAEDQKTAGDNPLSFLLLTCLLPGFCNEVIYLRTNEVKAYNIMPYPGPRINFLVTLKKLWGLQGGNVTLLLLSGMS